MSGHEHDWTDWVRPSVLRDSLGQVVVNRALTIQRLNGTDQPVTDGWWRTCRSCPAEQFSRPTAPAMPGAEGRLCGCGHPAAKHVGTGGQVLGHCFGQDCRCAKFTAPGAGELRAVLIETLGRHSRLVTSGGLRCGCGWKWQGPADWSPHRWDDPEPSQAWHDHLSDALLAGPLEQLQAEAAAGRDAMAQVARVREALRAAAGSTPGVAPVMIFVGDVYAALGTA